MLTLYDSDSSDSDSNCDSRCNTTEMCTFSDEITDALKVNDMSKCWVADTGATKHMTGNKDWLSEMKRSTCSVSTGGGHVMTCEGIGKVSLTVNIKGTKSDVTLHDVLYIPELTVNLFSTTRAVVHGNATAV